MNFLPIIVFFILSFLPLHASSFSSNDDYYSFKHQNYHIIYTQEFAKQAHFLHTNLKDYFAKNNKLYGFGFDEPLSIALVTPKLQIPNAFSMPIPHNQSIFYSGGIMLNESFGINSWLQALLSHEIAHNYQISAKKSKISKELHKYFGNTLLPILTPIPLFTLPNTLLPNLLIEGNAVLNESLYNNGGRLYSGHSTALLNALVRSNSLSPQRLLNDHLDFPYAQEKYLVGGFFMQYLMQEYGLKKTQRFFYAHSIHSINPLLINATFQSHFKKDFYSLLLEFVQHLKQKYSGYIPLSAQGALAYSQKAIALNTIGSKIVFTSHNGISMPFVHEYNLKTHSHKKRQKDLLPGKVFRHNNTYYSRASHFTSATHYTIGLFDSCANILPNSHSKFYNQLHNDTSAYYDVVQSLERPALYVNNSFYDYANTDAVFDTNNSIYYTKATKHNTTMFLKNKKRLFELVGYSYKIVAAQNNALFFIANSHSGSSLYQYKNGTFYRLSNYDNIIDAQIMPPHKLFVTALNHKGYFTKIIPIERQKISRQYFAQIQSNHPNHPPIKKFQKSSKALQSSKKYSEFSDLRLSSFYPIISTSSEKGTTIQANAFFTDTLLFNTINAYFFKDTSDTTIGASYTNERYIPVTIDIFDTKKKESTPKTRGYGGFIQVYGPLFKKQRHLLEGSLMHFFDDENRDKSPTIFETSYSFLRSYAHEHTPYRFSFLSGFLKEDRGDVSYGVHLKQQNHIANELYIKLQAHAISSDTKSLANQRGIKITNSESPKVSQKGDFYIHSIDNDLFATDLVSTTVAFSKTFRWSSYFSKFPFSIRKESVFFSCNYHTLKTLQNRTKTIDEKQFGIELDTLGAHKIPIPITITYTKSDTLNKDSLSVRLEVAF